MRLEALTLYSLQRSRITDPKARQEDAVLTSLELRGLSAELFDWLAQFRPMSAQPLASVAIPGTGRGDQTPVCRGVIEPLEVHQLMNDDVIAHPLWHGDQPPIEAHVPVTPARTPPRPLIADADAGYRETV